MIKIVEHAPGIIELKFKTDYDMHLGLMRFSDFYEGSKLKGQFFDHETFFRTWLEEYGNFDMFETICGYNLTDRDIRKFFQIFQEDALWDIEKQVKRILAPYLKSKEKFCILSCNAGDHITLNHELAHGYYYLDKEYKNQMDEDVKALSPAVWRRVRAGLKELGYIDQVLMDEAQAFLSTSTMADLHDMFGNLPWKQILKMQLRLQKTLEEI